MHAVGGAGPHVAVDIDAKAIKDAGRTDGKHLAAGKRPAVATDVEAADMARSVLLVARTCVGNVKALLVGREGDPIRLHEIGRNGETIRGRKNEGEPGTSADF